MNREKNPGISFVIFKAFISPELATTVGVLTEVPVMPLLVKIANRTQGWFDASSSS